MSDDAPTIMQPLHAAPAYPEWVGRVTASTLRSDLSAITNRVAHAGERLVLQRHKKEVLALVSVEDLTLLEVIDDLVDGSEAAAALSSGDTALPWTPPE